MKGNEEKRTDKEPTNGILREITGTEKKSWTDAGRTGGAALRFPHGDLKMGIRSFP